SSLHFDKDASVETHLNDAIYMLSKEILGKIHGRKAIILISDGGNLGGIVTRADAVAEAQRDNVPVYAVSYSAWSGVDMMPKGGIGGLNGVTLASGVTDPGMANLESWSLATGGHVYEVSRGSTLKQIFADIASELRSQYEIGYMPPSDTKPKRPHKLELKVKDKSLRVQARTGFYAYP
ncbi:MAG TPA: VWA domain-containing protein, partial [Terriglobus sp.]